MHDSRAPNVCPSLVGNINYKLKLNTLLMMNREHDKQKLAYVFVSCEGMEKCKFYRVVCIARLRSSDGHAPLTVQIWVGMHVRTTTPYGVNVG